MFDTDDEIVGKRVLAWVDGHPTLGEVTTHIRTVACTLYLVEALDDERYWYMPRHQFVTEK
jgi:hypothetical protein